MVWEVKQETLEFIQTRTFERMVSYQPSSSTPCFASVLLKALLQHDYTTPILYNTVLVMAPACFSFALYACVSTARY
jgi:hypothetical protein